MRDDVVSSTIQLVSSSPVSEQTYITNRFWESLQVANHCEDKQPLLQVAVWAIGEYGDLFMYGPNDDGTFALASTVFKVFKFLLFYYRI